jgi:hypothetical protein
MGTQMGEFNRRLVVFGSTIWGCADILTPRLCRYIFDVFSVCSFNVYLKEVKCRFLLGKYPSEGSSRSFSRSKVHIEQPFTVVVNYLHTIF